MLSPVVMLVVGRYVGQMWATKRFEAAATESTLQDLVDAALARATHEKSGVHNKVLRTMLLAFGFTPTEYDHYPLRFVFRRPAGREIVPKLRHLFP